MRTIKNPYIFFIGPRKTGTTSFYNILIDREIPITKHVKETFFFEQDQINLSDYKRHFGINPYKPFCEISPSYFTSLKACTNIKRLFPEARIIITLRDPVQRAMSAFYHLQRIGLIEYTSNSNDFFLNKHIWNVIDGSRYEKHVNNWGLNFPNNTIQIKQGFGGQYETEAIHALSSFIGVKLEAENIQALRSNKAKSARSIMTIRMARSLHRKLQKAHAFRLINTLKILKPFLFTKNVKTNIFDGVVRDFFSENLVDSILYYDREPLVRII